MRADKTYKNQSKRNQTSNGPNYFERGLDLINDGTQHFGCNHLKAGTLKRLESQDFISAKLVQKNFVTVEFQPKESAGAGEGADLQYSTCTSQITQMCLSVAMAGALNVLNPTLADLSFLFAVTFRVKKGQRQRKRDFVPSFICKPDSPKYGAM